MKNILISIFIALLIISCNKKPKATDKPKSVNETTQAEQSKKEQAPTKQIEQVDKRENDFKILKGIYEYVCEYNTDDLIENHYLNFNNKGGFYYGTSDDFDESREGYSPGFFMTQMEAMQINGDTISFELNINDTIFYKNPITPLYKTNVNRPWDVGVRYKSRKYKGKIQGDTITIITKGFSLRKFVKRKRE